MIPKRYSSYRSSTVVEDLSQYPEVEIIKNPPEWKYVERLLPSQLIPVPQIKQTYSSGWQPQKSSLCDKSKYFIARTKNHMIPVYLHRTFRGERRVTVIRRIEGDLWTLEKELREIVEKSRNGKLCASRVNEMSGQIRFHGDYVNLIKDHLMSKGY